MTELDTYVHCGREFREARFVHAVEANMTLEIQKRQMGGEIPVLIEKEIEIATRTARHGVYHTFIDILDFGEPDEIAQARNVVTVFQACEMTVDKTENKA